MQALSECEFPHLHKLWLSNKVDNIDGNKIGDEVRPLHKFKNLQYLDLSDVGLTHKGVEILSQGDFPHLSKLSLGNKTDILGGNDLDDQAIIFLHKFTTLKGLYLWSNDITDKGV